MQLIPIKLSNCVFASWSGVLIGTDCGKVGAHFRGVQLNISYCKQLTVNATTTTIALLSSLVVLYLAEK